MIQTMTTYLQRRKAKKLPSLYHKRRKMQWCQNTSYDKETRVSHSVIKFVKQMDELNNMKTYGVNLLQVPYVYTDES